MRDFAHQNVYSAIFSVSYFLNPGNSQYDTMDIDAKHVKRRGSSQGCASSEPHNQNLTLTSHFRQNRLLGPNFDGTLKPSPEKQFGH